MTRTLVVSAALLVSFAASLEFHQKCENVTVEPVKNFNVSQVSFLLQQLQIVLFLFIFFSMPVRGI